MELARGGHITPLARETLRERRITVAEEGRASATVSAWLSTPMSDPAHIRRLAKVRELERSQTRSRAPE